MEYDRTETIAFAPADTRSAHFAASMQSCDPTISSAEYRESLYVQQKTETSVNLNSLTGLSNRSQSERAPVVTSMLAQHHASTILPGGPTGQVRRMDRSTSVESSEHDSI